WADVYQVDHDDPNRYAYVHYVEYNKRLDEWVPKKVVDISSQIPNETDKERKKQARLAGQLTKAKANHVKNKSKNKGKGDLAVPPTTLKRKRTNAEMTLEESDTVTDTTDKTKQQTGSYSTSWT
ncbi:hypothetical protein SARC_05200, partial [Sphaeroforma arctica JP610]